MTMWDTIKKFGLAHCDLPTTLWNVAVMLRALTLNIDRRNITPIPVSVYLVCLVISLCYFFVYLVSVVWFVFVRCPETGDLLSALIVFSLGFSSEIGAFKLLFMFLHIDKIKGLVAEMLDCDASIDKGSRFYRNLLTTMRHVKKRALIFWLVIISNGIVYIVKPILLPGRHLMEDNFVLFGLEPMYETPNYQIAFLLTAGGVIFTCYLPANITAFLIVTTGYIEAHMLALAEELFYLREDAEEHYDKVKTTAYVLDGKNNLQRNKVINAYVERRLKSIIESHSRNIKLLHQVANIFSGAIASEFFILVIGLIAELLGGLENTYLEIPFAMMQVSMDCFTGQRVMDASVEFERAVYDCKWENYDKNNMKMTHIILTNSQKVMKLSAGGIVMLSFSCLMQMNRTIYSAYTALRTTMK